jgi:hypothetical protein
VRVEKILTAIQRNTIRILRKIPNAQATLMSEITWGYVVYSALQKRYFFPDFPIITEKFFGRVEETVSKVFNQNTHKKLGTFQFKMQVK